jgi:hypothetical protein
MFWVLISVMLKRKPKELQNRRPRPNKNQDDNCPGCPPATSNNSSWRGQWRYVMEFDLPDGSKSLKFSASPEPSVTAETDMRSCEILKAMPSFSAQSCK